MNSYKGLKKPIIFIGTGRSGTTIISELIMRHPDLAFPNNYQDNLPKSSWINMLRVFMDNKLWRAQGQKPQLNKVSFFNKYTFRPSEAYNMWDHIIGYKTNFSRDFMLDTQLGENQINDIRAYFNRMVKYQNRKRLAIKITGPSRLGFLLKIFPDALIINLRRELIPTINSFLKVYFWEDRGAKRLWWTGAYSKSDEEWAIKNCNSPEMMTAFQLKKIIDITNKELEQYNPDHLEVSYESFVASPNFELNRINDFIGLSDFNFIDQLEKIKIYNRNKKDSEYFNAETLDKIYKILNKNI